MSEMPWSCKWILLEGMKVTGGRAVVAAARWKVEISSHRVLRVTSHGGGGVGIVVLMAVDVLEVEV